MNIAAIRVLSIVLLIVAFIASGYWWGDNAATNRAAAHALTVERIASKNLQEANVRVRAIEQKSAQEINVISTTYQEDLSHVIATQKSLVAGIRSNAIRLSVPSRISACSTAGASTTSPSGRDATARCQLSDEAAEFLTGLASEADSISHQLSACQAVLTADRAAINQEQKLESNQ